MPKLQDVLQDHVEELVALGQFSELELFKRERKGSLEFKEGTLPAAIAVVVDSYRRWCGPDWKAMVLRLLETCREAKAKQNHSLVMLLLGEMEQIRWIAAADSELRDFHFSASHAALNAGGAASNAEQVSLDAQLGLRHDVEPITTRWMEPPWWDAVVQSGEDPKDLAMFFVLGGGAP